MLQGCKIETSFPFRKLFSSIIPITKLRESFGAHFPFTSTLSVALIFLAE